MIDGIDIHGLFIPPLLILAIVAWFVSGMLRRGLRVAGFYGWVWHPPLFDLALYVLVLSALTALTAVLR